MQNTKFCEIAASKMLRQHATVQVARRNQTGDVVSIGVCPDPHKDYPRVLTRLEREREDARIVLITARDYVRTLVQELRDFLINIKYDNRSSAGPIRRIKLCRSHSSPF